MPTSGATPPANWRCAGSIMSLSRTTTRELSIFAATPRDGGWKRSSQNPARTSIGSFREILLAVRFFLGVDGGQSSVTAVIGDERRRVLGAGRGGPCREIGNIAEAIS